MAIIHKKGFALLIAMIFISVMLAIGTAISSLGYKQVILSSSATRSQYSFYAADAVLECVLTQVQQSPPSTSANSYSFENYDDVSGTNSPICGTSNTEDQDSVNHIYSFKELCYNDGINPPTRDASYTGQCLSEHRVTRKRFEIAFSGHDSVANTGQLCADATVYTKKDLEPLTTYVYVQGYDVPCAEVDTNPRVITRMLVGQF
jgi:hypothetical protein